MGLRALIGRIAAAAAAAAALAMLAGCGSDDDEGAPSACRASSETYLEVLRAAPGPVRVNGIPISDCLTPSQGGGELAQIGEQMVIAATRLNAQASRDPGGPAAVQLGYLIGATSSGADAIHADLIRRLNSAARFSAAQAPPPAFNRGFNRGYAAGQESG
ncbi:MAG: hypothetical protein ACRDL6_05635 [Solirubrobacterales bacterium]